MSGRIADEVIAEIRDRADIVEVVGRYVQLKRAGTNHKGLCPFHEEKTPSFNVNPVRQFFHCFGCQATGDVFDFLMRAEGRTFIEAVEELAGAVGVEIPRERLSATDARAEAERRSDRREALTLNGRVARFYRRCLESPQGEVARRYLAARGIDDATSERFMLGFAPRSATQLTQVLRSKGIALEFAARVGLVARRASGGGYYDRFWNRLICPIINASGDVIGFGGRSLGEAGDAPKYINTPETAVYHKGETLYGLHAAGGAMRKAGQALLVEGNFDVLQLHRHGFANAVAPLGTALTSDQVRLLARFTPRVVAMFDGDKAGRAAARRAVKTLLEGGIEAKIASIPEGADPDSLLVQGGPDALRRVIDSAAPAIDFMISELRSTLEDTVPGRARVLEEVAPLVRQLASEAAQALYIDRLSLELQIDRAVVERVMLGRSTGRPAQARASVPERPRHVQGDPSAARPAPRVDALEFELLKLLLGHPDLLSRAESAHMDALLSSEALRETYSTALQMQRDLGSLDPVLLIPRVPAELRDVVATAAMSQEYAKAGDPTKALDDCVASLAASRSARIVQRVKERIVRAQRGQTLKDCAAADIRRLDVLAKLQFRIKNARDRREAEQVWALVPELVEVEREIHETQ